MKVIRLLAIGALLIAAAAQSSFAQDEDPNDHWKFTTEFAWVQTAGNAETSTLGLGATALRKYPKSELLFELGGIRTESALKTRTAFGTVDDFVVNTTENREKTAENYYARGRYDYKVTTAFSVFGGVDWMRNVFTGIDSRTLIGLGAANIWKDTDALKFRTNYAATYTFEEEVVSNPFTNSNFPGVRLSYNLFWMMTETTDFESRFITDWNLDNTDDVRVDFTNALPVDISSKMALRPALQLLWRNDPALTTVPLLDGTGAETGETVATPLEELDAIFTLTLVIKI